ncbi:MAG: DNA cytosine methyltransferase [Gloeocapsa sp. UFS-A4-WI-NPMV-4B04]|jgi:DNA (cytosine-5)-methyltransferase 1|nr:DNA cytosine methyltransferase [Gloeocapsa sp. UFS-A4-WI-NPMV-4B04]
MLTHLDLFSGIGGFTKAGELVGGITTTQFIEREKDAQLVRRSHWSGIPIHDDIRTYSPRIREFDLFTIGFPCTGTSNAGTRTGLDHPESALWRESLRCICIGRPQFVVVEQPEGFIQRGLQAVLGGLRMAGYKFGLCRKNREVVR